jgi:TolB-like protein
VSISIVRFFSIFLLALSTFSCAYRLGIGNRAVPGGYKSVSVPMFKNRSMETGIEVSFTNAMLQQFQRSHVAKIVDDNLSEVRIEGEISEVRYLPGAKQVSGDAAAPYLPEGTVLATEYTILLSAKVRVVRRSDNIEIWAGKFDGERTYSAPQVTIAGLNSVNPLYNQSARRQNIDSLATDLMAEAHNRMTESF